MSEEKMSEALYITVLCPTHFKKIKVMKK